MPNKEDIKNSDYNNIKKNEENKYYHYILSANIQKILLIRKKIQMKI